MARYDVLIVGSGFFGATVAAKLREAGRRVLVLERRDHVAGNAADTLLDGQRVCKFGAHIFHTSNKEIEAFVRQFGAWQPVTHRKYARVGTSLYAFPINLMTLYQLWGVTSPSEAKEELERRRLPQSNPHANLEAWCLHSIGPDLYELFMKHYTAKMWGRPCHELPATIVKRIPVRLSYDDRYFDDPFEAVPQNGYVDLVSNMLSGCEVRFGVDYLRDRSRWDALADLTVYTGPLDAFYGYRYGCLAYRSLDFAWSRSPGDIQGALTVNWPGADVARIRTEEYAHLWAGPGGWLCTSTPDAYDDPRKDALYPVRDAESMERLAKYQGLVDGDRTVFGGRLSTYQYINMDAAVGQALKASRHLLAQDRAWRSAERLAEVQL
jgi:UDP-galactopyranose mutase